MHVEVLWLVVWPVGGGGLNLGCVLMFTTLRKLIALDPQARSKKGNRWTPMQRPPQKLGSIDNQLVINVNERIGELLRNTN